MYPLGHLGTALLFAAPVAALLGPRTQTGFTVYALFAAWLPDLDKHVSALTHHGVTHTVAFGVVAGLAAGAAAAGVVAVARATTGRGLAERFDPGRVFAFVALGLFLGVVSHVTADVLVLLEDAQPVSPFWPVGQQSYAVEVVDLGAPVRNGGLLVLGTVAHAVVSWRTGDAEADEMSPA
jgi:membrane-bound metal-dependent hydrolase YbcI (DUF457 family)